MLQHIKKAFQMKNLAKAIAVIFFCFLMLTIETAAYFLFPQKTRLDRILFVLEQDPELFWKQRSNLNTIFEGVLIKTNGMGLRNGKINSKKKKSVIRIVCLGASPTFGWGVNENQIYSFKLEQMLRQKYSQQKEIEVINAGVIGYSSYQGLQLLKKKIIKMAPDIITIPYVINDVDKYRFFRNNGEKDEELEKKKDVFVKIENFLNRSNIVRIFRRIQANIRPVRWQYFGNNTEGQYFDMRRVSEEDYQDNLEAILHLANENNIKVMFITMPVNLPKTGNVSETARSQAGKNIDQAIELAKKENIQGAVHVLKKAVEHDPFSSRAFYFLGVYNEKLNEKDKARNYFKKAVKNELFECARLAKDYNRIMSNVAKIENIPLVDIIDQFDKFHENDGRYLFLDPDHDTIHPNRLGHYIIAEAVYQEMIKYPPFTN